MSFDRSLVLCAPLFAARAEVVEEMRARRAGEGKTCAIMVSFSVLRRLLSSLVSCTDGILAANASLYGRCCRVEEKRASRGAIEARIEILKSRLRPAELRATAHKQQATQAQAQAQARVVQETAREPQAL